MARNRVRQKPGKDLLTYFSQTEHANYPRRVLYHHKVSFIRADLLGYRKLERFVNQTSLVPLSPCRYTVFSDLALSPEASSGCLNRNKLFAVPSRSLQKVFLFSILKTRLCSPCSSQQPLSLQPTTGSSCPAQLAACKLVQYSQDKANRQVSPACLHLFEVQTPVDYK